MPPHLQHCGSFPPMRWWPAICRARPSGLHLVDLQEIAADHHRLPELQRLMGLPVGAITGRTLERLLAGGEPD